MNVSGVARRIALSRRVSLANPLAGQAVDQQEHTGPVSATAYPRTYAKCLFGCAQFARFRVRICTSIGVAALTGRYCPIGQPS